MKQALEETDETVGPLSIRFRTKYQTHYQLLQLLRKKKILIKMSRHLLLVMIVRLKRIFQALTRSILRTLSLLYAIIILIIIVYHQGVHYIQVIDPSVNFHYEAIPRHLQERNEPYFVPLENRILTNEYWINAENRLVYRYTPYVPTINDLNQIKLGTCNILYKWITQQLQHFENNRIDLMKTKD